MSVIHVVSVSGGKACSHCKAVKPTSEFYADRQRPDGKQYVCKQCQRAFQRAYRIAARARGALTYSQENYRRLRLEVLLRYSPEGATSPSCACCSEGLFEFLSIDHIDGGGRQHRQQIAGEKSHFYRWVKSHGFPPGYRVLCHNCNQALGNFGYCPHTRNTP